MVPRIQPVFFLLVCLAVSVKMAWSQQEKKKLEIVTILEEPFMMEKDDGSLAGYCHDLAVQICSSLNMEPSIHLVADGRYGSKNSDGEWTGMIGELVGGKAQVAVASLTITKERKEVVHFTDQFMTAATAFIRRKPVPYVPDVVVNMLSVFTFQVWILLLISVILITLGLWAVAFLIGDEEFCRVEVVINYIITSLLFFSPIVQPTRAAVRAYTYLWLVFRIIVFLVFVVHFIHFATVQRLDAPIETFDDLAYAAKKDSVDILMVSNGATEQKFEMSHKSSYEQIYERYERQGYKTDSGKEGLEMVKKSSQYVYIGEMPLLKYTAGQNCDLYVGGDSDSLHPQRGFGIAVSKSEDEALQRNISNLVHQLREDGVLEKIEEKWFRKPVCPESGDGIHALSVVVARSMFLFVLILLLYAIAVFIYSKIAGRSVNKRNENQDDDKNENLKMSADIEHKA